MLTNPAVNPIDNFIQAMDMAAQLAHQADVLTGQQAISKRKEAICFATKAFENYSELMVTNKLFLPQIEQFAFNFIAIRYMGARFLFP